MVAVVVRVAWAVASAGCGSQVGPSVMGVWFSSTVTAVDVAKVKEMYR